MSETRPSMIKSCRVWLRDRQDIPEKKRLCINTLFDRAEPIDVFVTYGQPMVCPICGGKVNTNCKFCRQCGQRVNVRREPICTDDVMRDVLERIERGETVQRISDTLGIKLNTLKSKLSAFRCSNGMQKKQQYTVAEIKKAYERHRDGESWPKIGRDLNRNPESLRAAVIKFLGKSEEE